MNLITSSAKSAKVTGVITSGRGKRLQTVNVNFKLSNDRFKVNLPEIKRKPYTLSIAIEQNKKTSNVTFKNVD